MQTKFSQAILNTPQGREAGTIIRNCVHCGFCNATCPTYQILGDELDGPRGRIYLINQMLEGAPVTHHTLTHLDRCLTCRNCETTCPSGVQYGQLLDIGRAIIVNKVTRPWHQRLARWLLRRIVPYRGRFTPLLRLAQLLRPLLPGNLKRSIPMRRQSILASTNRHNRTMLVLAGCVQPAMAPNINAACTQVLDRLGIHLVAAPAAGCCGALCHHLDALDEALHQARRNINAWWPYIEAGAEAIVMTASGCGVHVKHYGYLLRDDPQYAAKAARVADLCKDIGEVLIKEDLALLPSGNQRSVAFHSPCTLQHGQRLTGIVEHILNHRGFSLTPVPEGHLCCGSAGSYSLLQPVLSRQLRTQKLQALQSGSPQFIATANIGCWAHLQSGTILPVRHWIELLVGD